MEKSGKETFLPRRRGTLEKEILVHIKCLGCDRDGEQGSNRRKFRRQIFATRKGRKLISRDTENAD